MSDIYEEILNLPECWLKVGVPDGAGGSSPADSAVRIRERDRGTGNGVLLEKVDDAILQIPTVRTLIKLFDNYTPAEGQPDVDLQHPTHGPEVQDFLDQVMQTEPMRRASNYLQQQAPAQFPNVAAVRDWTLQVWFEPFTNEYAQKEHHCSGFEHVFVGEVQQGAHPGDNKMDIGGYHSWLKYWVDQQNNLVQYRGHDYRPEVATLGKTNPREASVIMTWKVNNIEYLKNPGGFFVAELPEMQIALGAIGVFDSLRKTFATSAAGAKSTERRVRLGDDLIDLVVYPQTVRTQGGAAQVGDHLRSMYPKYRGKAPTGGSGSVQPTPQPSPHTQHNQGPIRIVAALPNPPGTDDTGEWVELFNATQHTLSLSGWTVRDGQQRRRTLTGNLPPGSTRRVPLDRTEPDSPQLGNQGGWIYLFEGTERVAAVRYGNAGSGSVITF